MFNFNDATRTVLDRWNIGDDQINALCHFGFKDRVVRNLADYQGIEASDLHNVLDGAMPMSEYAWVYRALLAASYEVPHMRNLCMPQADGTSFLDKLRELDAASEQQFMATLQEAIGKPMAMSMRNAMELAEAPFYRHYSQKRELYEIRQQLGCDEVFQKLWQIACIADPRTEYGADRHLLDAQIDVLNNIECTYSRGALAAASYEAALRKVGLQTLCTGINECQALRKRLMHEFNRKYINNGVLALKKDFGFPDCSTCNDPRYANPFPPIPA